MCLIFVSVECCRKGRRLVSTRKRTSSDNDEAGLQSIRTPRYDEKHTEQVSVKFLCIGRRKTASILITRKRFGMAMS